MTQSGRPPLAEVWHRTCWDRSCGGSLARYSGALPVGLPAGPGPYRLETPDNTVLALCV